MQVGRRLILVTGATGYVGGLLVSLLEARGERLRCLVRRPGRLPRRINPETEIVVGDAADPHALQNALRGVDTAYYLIHSLGEAADFAERDASAARAFALAAAECGVRRIIYLGGLGREGPGLSNHLRSRQEVGRILRESGVPTIEFRASIIIGSGSLSFELVRSLVEKLPVMVTPKWVREAAQPIYIDDVLEYLIRAADLPDLESRIFEIGGADVTSYEGIMRTYARLRGLSRLMLRVPVLTPYLSSLWLGLVTPIYASVGRVLIESVRNPTTVEDRSALEVFPVRPISTAEAVSKTLEWEDRQFHDLRFSELLSNAGPGHRMGRVLGRLYDSRAVHVDADPDRVFGVVCCLGGENGYFGWDWLWRLRGLLDRLIGGIGMRRGRVCGPVPEEGDEIDWWRVVRVEPGRLLRLAAEMKLPGRAWLDFEVTQEQERTLVRQTAVFDPRGLTGLIYWWAVYPAHSAVFRGMLSGIVRRCRVSQTGKNAKA